MFPGEEDTAAAGLNWSRIPPVVDDKGLSTVQGLGTSALDHLKGERMRLENIATLTGELSLLPPSHWPMVSYRPTSAGQSQPHSHQGRPSVG